jgi:hypothetical protein
MLAAVACGGLIGAASVTARAEPAGGTTPEQRIEASIRAWFALLAARAPGSCAVEDLVSAAPFEFALAAGELASPEGFRAWVSELRSPHPQVSYRLGAIRSEAVGDGLYRARFGFDRRGVDEAGLPHVARGEQAWLIRARAGEPAVVLRIDRERQLVFPGTGPQVVCY